MTGGDVPALFGIGDDIVKLGFTASRDDELEVAAHGGELVVALALPFPEQGSLGPARLALPDRQKVHSIDMPGGIDRRSRGCQERRQEIDQVDVLRAD